MTGSRALESILQKQSAWAERSGIDVDDHPAFSQIRLHLLEVVFDRSAPSAREQYLFQRPA